MSDSIISQKWPIWPLWVTLMSFSCKGHTHRQYTAVTVHNSFKRPYRICTSSCSLCISQWWSSVNCGMNLEMFTLCTCSKRIPTVLSRPSVQKQELECSMFVPDSSIHQYTGIWDDVDEAPSPSKALWKTQGLVSPPSYQDKVKTNTRMFKPRRLHNEPMSTSSPLIIYFKGYRIQ